MSTVYLISLNVWGNIDVKYNAYIYPITGRLKTGVYNPYIDNFIQSSEGFVDYVNKENPTGIGIFNIFRFLYKIDVLFLNWIENLPDKKLGLIQTYFFLMILRLKKIFKIKVVWTLHNKISHYPKNIYFKKLLFKNLLKNSDLIITHSQEGISFAEKLCPGVSSRIFYFPHPVVPVKKSVTDTSKKYDILIWGLLLPYKKIDDFLKHIHENNLMNKYRILIAGKAVSDIYLEKIDKYCNEKITIINRFIENNELELMMSQAKVVLFTYSGKSVLSSGALIDSIANRSLVIGPDVGAFAEMGQSGVISTYKDFDDLIKLLDRTDEILASDRIDRITKFIEEHSWSQFADGLKSSLIKAG